MAAHPASQGDAHARDALAAHADLTSALVHLRRTLDATPVAGPPASGASATEKRGRGPRTLRDLERRACPRPWEVPPPVTGPAAPIAEAARLIRTAADLWATHQTPTGQPRSREGSRMRHPATLGAATREWAALVALAADTARATVAMGRLAGLPEELLTPALDYPRPPDSAGLATGSVDLGVARPSVRAGRGLVELEDRIERLRTLAWSLSERGDAPVSVHRNIAAIGVLLHRAAATAHARVCGARLAAVPDGDAPDREGRPGADPHRIALQRAERGARQWEAVESLIAPLRTTHPAAHPVQVERLDIERLLTGLPPARGDDESRAAAWTLSRVAESFAEVARFNAHALHAAHEDGELHMLGRGIPNHALPRRPDLVRARLTDALIPAPTAAVRQIEGAYREIWSTSRAVDRETTADGTP